MSKPEELELAKEGYVYEVRGDVGVYIGESSEIK